MSTLKTHNLQSPDAGSVNIAMSPNAGMVVTGISTFSNDVFVGSGITCHANAGIVSANTISSGPISLFRVDTGGRVRTTNGFLTLQSVLGTVIEDVDGNNQIKANNDSSVQLYFNANEKLVTTNTGVSITGTISAADLVVQGTGVVGDLESSNNEHVLGLKGNNASVKSYVGTDSSGNFKLSTGSNVDERIRIKTGGDFLTQGLTSPSFDNQGSNGTKYEFTGAGTAGKFPVINVSGNSNTDGGTIGVIRFVNRENANNSSGNNNQSKGLFELDVRSTTSDSNAGDDSGGYVRFITKDEGNVMSERFVLTAKGRFKANNRENLGGIRERTSGVLANGESVSWNGSGTTYTNGNLNFNGIGGNGGGWIGCLSVTAADGAPSGALVIVGVHGSGFNNYNMLQNSFDGGITVTPTGTGAGSNFWNAVISNTSGDTVYYRMLIYHLSTLSSTVYGL